MGWGVQPGTLNPPTRPPEVLRQLLFLGAAFPGPASGRPSSAPSKAVASFPGPTAAKPLGSLAFPTFEFPSPLLEIPDMQ